MVNCTNIAGNSIFIFGLGMGPEGAAIATLCSRIIAATVLTVMLVRQRRLPIGLAGLHKITMNRSMAGRILNVGVPSGLEGSMFQIGRLLTQRIFTSFGTAAIAGNAIASVLNAFSYMPGNAFCMAILTVVGQCIGAGDYGGAKKNAVKIMKMSWLTLLVLSGIIFIFMEPLISIFNLSPEAHALARSFLQVHCVSMAVGWTLSFALPNALRAAGDVRYVMWSSGLSMFAVRVSFAYLITFAFLVGPLGVWIAMGLDFLVRGSFFVSRWVGGKWQEKKVI
jgi:Na+-driven multidrug efflux pump